MICALFITLPCLLLCVIQLERGLRSTVDAFRLQEVVKPLYWELVRLPVPAQYSSTCGTGELALTSTHGGQWADRYSACVCVCL